MPPGMIRFRTSNGTLNGYYELNFWMFGWPHCDLQPSGAVGGRHSMLWNHIPCEWLKKCSVWFSSTTGCSRTPKWHGLQKPNRTERTKLYPTYSPGHPFKWFAVFGFWAGHFNIAKSWHPVLVTSLLGATTWQGRKYFRLECHWIDTLMDELDLHTKSMAHGWAWDHGSSHICSQMPDLTQLRVPTFRRVLLSKSDLDPPSHWSGGVVHPIL